MKNARCIRSSLTVSERGLRCLAVAMLVVYVSWQALWLALGQIPPSLFLALTGWPAPTTGCTRSLRALAAGDWLASLEYNPFTVVLVALLVATIAWLVKHLRHLNRTSLPQPMVRA